MSPGDAVDITISACYLLKCHIKCIRGHSSVTPRNAMGDDGGCQIFWKTGYELRCMVQRY